MTIATLEKCEYLAFLYDSNSILYIACKVLNPYTEEILMNFSVTNIICEIDKHFYQLSSSTFTTAFLASGVKTAGIQNSSKNSGKWWDICWNPYGFIQLKAMLWVSD